MKPTTLYGQTVHQHQVERKLDASNTAFTSPNYFMSLAANHMKCEKYLLILHYLHNCWNKIPAASRIATENRRNQFRGHNVSGHVRQSDLEEITE